MNTLQGHIRSIAVSGSLSVVTVDVGLARALKAILIETPETATYLREGHAITLLFKETELVLAKHPDHPISIPNRIAATITRIRRGQLLSEIQLQTAAGSLVAIISTLAVDELEIKEGDAVTAMVKLNEIMLSE